MVRDTAVSEAQPARKWWSSPWFKLGLSVVLLSFLLLRTNLSELGAAVSGAHLGWVAAAFAGYFFSQVISSIRWTMLARAVGFDEPYSHFFGAYFTGMYMNLFAPSTVAGDIGRTLFLAGTKKSKALALTTVIADRGLGFVVLIWIAAFAILTQPGYRLPAPIYYGSWIIPPATLLSWFYLPHLVVRLFAPEHRWRRLVERDLEAYWRDWRLLIKTSLVAGAFHVIQIFTQVLLAWALDIRAPLSFFFIFVAVVNILGMLPVSFSGIGIREGGYWFFLAQVGVSRHDALALGLLSSAVVLATGLCSGLIFLLWKNQLPAPRTAVRDTYVSRGERRVRKG